MTTNTLPKLTYSQILEIGNAFETTYGDWNVFLDSGLAKHAANHEAFNLAFSLEQSANDDVEKEGLKAISEAATETRKDVVTLLTEHIAYDKANGETYNYEYAENTIEQVKALG